MYYSFTIYISHLFYFIFKLYGYRMTLKKDFIMNQSHINSWQFIILTDFLKIKIWNINPRLHINQTTCQLSLKKKAYNTLLLFYHTAVPWCNRAIILNQFQSNTVHTRRVHLSVKPMSVNILIYKIHTNSNDTCTNK